MPLHRVQQTSSGVDAHEHREDLVKSTANSKHVEQDDLPCFQHAPAAAIRQDAFVGDLVKLALVQMPMTIAAILSMINSNCG